ncbi:MAG: type IV pilus assembly protein FimV [Litorivicinaceae bacterium]
MRWIYVGCALMWSVTATAQAMSVEEAMRHLLKDLDNTKVVTVPTPAPVVQGPATPRTRTATAPAPAGSPQTVRVARGQTLDQIIQRVMPGSPVQMDVVRRAFVTANPHAFRKGNPNWLYAGVTLTIPTLEHFRAVVFKSNALELKKNVSDEKASWVRFP